MKNKINKINIIFILLLLNMFLFSPSIGLSEGFNYKQKLNPESSASSLKPLDLNFSSFDYQKPLIKLKKKLKILKRNYMLTNKSSKKTTNIKLLLGDVFTIHYVHNSGLGIAYNNIGIKIEYGMGTSPVYVLPRQDVYTISYNFNYDKLSFDFGLGAFAGYGEVHGCANVHTCYGNDHEIEINDGILIQLFSSYEILKYLDITLGINWIMFTIEDKKVSYSDYRLDPREEGIIWSPSLGFSIVF